MEGYRQTSQKDAVPRVAMARPRRGSLCGKYDGHCEKAISATHTHSVACPWQSGKN